MRQNPHLLKISILIISLISFALLQSCSGTTTATQKPLATATCQQAPCQNMLFIVIGGSTPENYTVEASDQQGDTVSVHCVNDSRHLRPTQDLTNNEPVAQSLCENDGLHLIGFTPKVVDLKIYWGDQEKSQIFHPNYSTFYSTAANCSPSCKISVIKMQLP